MNSTELHEDHFLKILWDEQSRVIGIDWKETTTAMSDDDMKNELILFAGYVEEKRAPRVLVDVTKFHFRLSPAMQEWRVKNISSRYNAAGVKRFAFVFPADAQIPPTMNQPVEGEDFMTRAFNNRADAVRWLVSN